MFSPVNERDQSEFNMAFSWLNRLNYWFYICDESSSKMDSYQWFQSLLILFRELSTEMKEPEIKEKREELSQLWDEVNRSLSFQNKTGKTSVNSELYWKLNNFEMYLRSVLKGSGLQQRIKESAWDALK